MVRAKRRLSRRLLTGTRFIIIVHHRILATSPRCCGQKLCQLVSIDGSLGLFRFGLLDHPQADRTMSRERNNFIERYFMFRNINKFHFSIMLGSIGSVITAILQIPIFNKSSMQEFFVYSSKFFFERESPILTAICYS